MDHRISLPRASALAIPVADVTTAKVQQTTGSAAPGPDALAGRSSAGNCNAFEALQHLPVRRSASRPVAETDPLPADPISPDSTGHVSDFLGADERKVLRLVNCDSRRTGAQRYTGLKVGRDTPLDKLAPMLQGLPNVTHIRIADTRYFGDQELEMMARQDAEAGGRITHLHLRSCRALTDDGLAHLKGFRNLQSVDLQNCGGISNAGLVHLKELDGLRSLNLSTCRCISDAGLGHLGQLTGLTALNLEGCEEVTDAGLMHLEDMHGLELLNLDLCRRITNAGLVHVNRLEQLTSLSLGCCAKVTKLAALGKLTKMESLTLSGCISLPGAELENIRHMQALQKLHLYGARLVDDAALLYLQGLPRLRCLDLFECPRITDDGIAHLHGLPDLEILRLPNRNISARAALPLRRRNVTVAY